MNTDVSFNWQKDDGIEEIDTGPDTLTQDQGDCDITQPVAILKLADDTSPDAVQEIGVDPYNNDYWIRIARQ